MKRLAIAFALLAVAVAIVTAAGVIHSALLGNGPYRFEESRRGAELAAGALLAVVLLVSAFLLDRFDRRS